MVISNHQISISHFYQSFLSINTLSKPLGGSSRPFGDENEISWLVDGDLSVSEIGLKSNLPAKLHILKERKERIEGRWLIEI